MLRRLPISPLFPYTTLFRSEGAVNVTPIPSIGLAPLSVTVACSCVAKAVLMTACCGVPAVALRFAGVAVAARKLRSEEHTSELQSPCNLVCRLLLEKKKKHN